MSRVLVIHDDVSTLLAFKATLRSVGHHVATAALGDDGVLAAVRDQFDVVLCHQHLPDLTGLEIARQIREGCPHTSIVLMTAPGAPAIDVFGSGVGAITCVTRPLAEEALVRVVNGALLSNSQAALTQPAPVGYAARRWMDLVFRALQAADDSHSVAVWCKTIAVARGTLQKRCDAVGVKPKDSLDFVRLLRVAIQHPGEPWDLQSWLDVADERTARALIRRAGLASHCCVPSVDAFLPHQQLIPRSELIEVLQARIARMGLSNHDNRESVGQVL